MITHVVLLKPRADLSAPDRSAFVAALARALREIPSVRGFRVGRRVRFGAGYEANMPDAADFAAFIEFDDLDGLRAYLGHPAHADLGRLFGEVAPAALVYDFETGAPNSLAAALI
jgi:hypothetical protein